MSVLGDMCEKELAVLQIASPLPIADDKMVETYFVVIAL